MSVGTDWTIESPDLIVCNRYDDGKWTVYNVGFAPGFLKPLSRRERIQSEISNAWFRDGAQGVRDWALANPKGRPVVVTVER